MGRALRNGSSFLRMTEKPKPFGCIESYENIPFRMVSLAKANSLYTSMKVELELELELPEPENEMLLYLVASLRLTALISLLTDTTFPRGSTPITTILDFGMYFYY